MIPVQPRLANRTTGLPRYDAKPEVFIQAEKKSPIVAQILSNTDETSRFKQSKMSRISRWICWLTAKRPRTLRVAAASFFDLRGIVVEGKQLAESLVPGKTRIPSRADHGHSSRIEMGLERRKLLYILSLSSRGRTRKLFPGYYLFNTCHLKQPCQNPVVHCRALFYTYIRV